MFNAGKQLYTSLSAAQRINTLNINRRVLERERHHTTEEVQGLRASLEKAQKELEEQRLAHAGQQRTSTQVEEEQQAQLTALERARDDAIESLNDLREVLIDRHHGSKSSRRQSKFSGVSSKTLGIPSGPPSVFYLHHATGMSEETFSLQPSHRGGRGNSTSKNNSLLIGTVHLLIAMQHG